MQLRTSFGLLAFWALAVQAADLPPVEGRPIQVSDGGYVSSEACKTCHPKQHASWQLTYHRTMSQAVTAETVIADFDEVHLQLDDQAYALTRDANAFWVQPPGSTERRQVMQSTGSHHYQLYWYTTGRARELRMLPFAFLKNEQRWVPRHSVFLEPPGVREEPLTWNVQCLPCHSTNGRPQYDADTQLPNSQIAELGIACEACHGPGARHAGADDPAAVPMVHPKKVAAETSAQVCGQCHSVNVPFTQEAWIDWLLDGPTFRPGDDLSQHRYVVERGQTEKSSLLAGWLQKDPTTFDQWFWPDGMVRVTGREYNGIRASPCFQGGEFSCVSCHSLHDGSRDDQLAQGMRTSAACTQCHDWSTAKTEAHTHHPISSSGSNCLNCHMPNTNYGLLKATRSHTISSPSIAETVDSGRPNACNLCHLNQTLAWTQTHLNDWYASPSRTLSDQQATVPAAALGALTGDAAERAIYYWHMGWQPARDVSGSDWLTPYLAEGLTDTYDAVRYIAAKSLKAAPDYDYIGPETQRRAARDRVLEAWEPTQPFDAELFRRLLATRKDPPTKMGE